MEIDNGFYYFNISDFLNELKTTQKLNPIQQKIIEYFINKIECAFSYSTYYKDFTASKNILKFRENMSFSEIYKIIKTSK